MSAPPLPGTQSALLCVAQFIWPYAIRINILELCLTAFGCVFPGLLLKPPSCLVVAPRGPTQPGAIQLHFP